MTDPGKIEEVRSRLYDYVSLNPTGEHADKARQILATLPARDPSDASGHGPRDLTDDQAGVGSGPLASRVLSVAGGKPLVGLPGPPQDVTAAPRPHVQTELEGDPMAQEILGQAMTMPLLHVAGLGLSGIGRKLLDTRAGQAAKFLADQGAPVAAPKPTSFLEPSPEFDPMGDLAKARDELKLKAPHTVMHLGSLGALMAPAEFAARNVAPLAGRAALPMIRTGEGAARAVAAPWLAGNPLLQAATGRE